jgi:hypothetical protein
MTGGMRIDVTKPLAGGGETNVPPFPLVDVAATQSEFAQILVQLTNLDGNGIQNLTARVEAPNAVVAEIPAGT